MSINHIPVEMELDSGSPVTIIPKNKFMKLLPSLKLQPADIRLATSTGEQLNVCGYVPVTVEYERQKHCMKLNVVEGGKTSLIGLDWLSKIQLNWKDICYVNSMQTTMPSTDQLKTRYSELFDANAWQNEKLQSDYT